MALLLGFTSPPLEVEPFDGIHKFRLWQILVKDLLEHEGLIETLGGKSNKPDDMTDQDWKILKVKALWIILKSLTHTVKCSVLNETSPKTLWNKLGSDYALNSLRNRLFQKKKLYELKMGEGMNIQDHITLFRMLLEKTDLKIEEEDKVMMLLTSLPNPYDNLVTNFLSWKKTVNVDDVITLLLENENKSGISEVEYSSPNEEESPGDCLANEWIFGTAAPFHICSHRDWFDNNYEPYEGYIYTHTGHEIEIVGIGDVKVKMYDGSLMTLSGVRHVPTYVTNMISIVRLSKTGYRWMLEGGVTTITKGDKVVMEGDMLPNGFFKLKGCAMKSEYVSELRIESSKNVVL